MNSERSTSAGAVRRTTRRNGAFSDSGSQYREPEGGRGAPACGLAPARPDDGIDRLGRENSVDRDVREGRLEDLRELSRRVLARVVAVPRPLPVVEAIDAIWGRDERRTVRVEDAPDLPQPRNGIVEVGDHLERDHEVERAIGRTDGRPVVRLEDRAIALARVGDDLGVDLETAIVGAGTREDLGSVSLTEADVQNARSRMDEAGRGFAYA